MFKWIIFVLLILLGLILLAIFKKKENTLDVVKEHYKKIKNKSKGGVKVNALQNVKPSYYLIFGVMSLVGSLVVALYW